MRHNLKILLFIIAAVLLYASGTAYAQLINASRYYFNAATGQFIGVGATPPQLIGPNSDDVASAVTDIGFDFWLAGTKYTQFSVDENGLIKLGGSVITPEPINNMASNLNLPKIAPYWDDLATGPTGSVVYLLGGTAPTRYLIVQWNVILKNVAGTPAASFQARLYEGTGNIQFKSSAAIATNNGGYSSGIGVSATDFASITIVSATSATISYGTANNNNTLGTTRQMQFTTDNTAPTINANAAINIPNIPGTANRSLSTVIADQAGSVVSGIPLEPSVNVPRIYFKKNAEGSWFSTPGALTAGNETSGTWSFTVDHSLLGGVAEGDKIYYYVIAQDNGDYKGSPNIKSNPIGGVASDVNTVTSPPANPPYYIIPMSFSGTKTVGTDGDFTSLTLPGGLFEQISAGQLNGNLTVNIISDLNETGAKALTAWTNEAGGPFTITINPVGHRTISGATFNGGTANLLSLNGVTGLTIDGLNDASNSLTIVQTGQYLVGAVIELRGASNNTITRATIKGFGASNSAIMITTAATPSSNNTISHCNITSSVVIPNTSNAGQGISLLNASTGTIVTGDHNVIDNNMITNFVYNGITTVNTSAFTSGKFSNTVISNNDIYNTVGTSWNNNYRGIYIAGAVVGTTNIFNNKIHDLLVQTNVSSTGIPAILTSGSAGTTSNIYNNVIYLDASFTHPMQTWYGIQTSGAGAVNIYYNSMYIGGTNVTAVTSTYGSYGIHKGGTGATNIFNNVIFNARSNSTGTGKHYGIYAPSLNLLTSDYNDIFTPGTGGYLGFNATDRLTLNDWQTATTKDLHSYSGDPGFTSAENLTPNPDNLNTNILNGHGIPIMTISSDILGNPRSTTLPTPTDIGAYEFTPTIVPLNISGNAGAPNVNINWVDGSTTANANGDYLFQVMPGWTGSITPSLAGYVFTPKNIVINTPVNSDLANQDFTAINIPNGLVSLWKLDETTGDIYADLAQINNGTGNPSPTAAAGRVNGAQQFNGTSNKIEVPANASFDFTANSNFSVEFLYNGASAPTATKVAVGRSLSSSLRWWVGINPSDGKAKLYMLNGGKVISITGSAICDGQWHHVAATRNGSTGQTKIYVDGVLKNTATQLFTVDFASPSAKLEIGSFTNNYFLNGSLDEVALHNVELSAAQVTEHFTKSSNGVGYFSSMAPVITTTAPLDGVVNQAYTYDVDAAGSPAPAYSLTTFPSGMTINSATGLIEWTPAVAGNFDVTVSASNGVNPDASQSFTIAVSPAVVIPAGLEAYWKLDETSGTSFADFTDVNNGIGNATPVTGKVGGAQQFNGTNSKIEVPANPSIDFAANGNFSVEFWFQGANIPTATKVIIGRYLLSTLRWWVGINPADGKAKFYMSNGGTVSTVTGSAICDGQWHHVAATRNGTTGESKIYVDGVLKNTVTQLLTVDFASPSAKLEIGCFTNNYFLNGALDEVALHSVELSAADILQHYNNGGNGQPLAKKISDNFADLDIPSSYNLAQNYPNPFNPSTTVSYELPNDSRVNIQIFNVIGEQVAELVNDLQTAGYYNQRWDASNLPSGIYLLRIEANAPGSDQNFVKTVKMLLMK